LKVAVKRKKDYGGNPDAKLGKGIQVPEFGEEEEGRRSLPGEVVSSTSRVSRSGWKGGTGDIGKPNSSGKDLTIGGTKKLFQRGKLIPSPPTGNDAQAQTIGKLAIWAT